MSALFRSALIALLLAFIAGCARPGGTPSPTPNANGPVSEEGEGPAAEDEEPPPPPRATDPAVEPRVAMLAGLMPLTNTGVDDFLARDSTADGRGVLIGILDSGVDLGMPGMAVTTTGERKVLDVRDFSREGRIALAPITISGDTVRHADKTLAGFGRVRGSTSPPYYAGVLRERPLGDLPASDLNGNETNRDEFLILAVRSTQGWAVVTDTDDDGRLDDETLVHDYLVGAETFTLGSRDGDNDGPMTIAVNFESGGGAPVLDLFFDNSAHGSHVSGIAAGHDMFGVEDFNGVAPGAQLVVAKIANNARGGLSVTGSMVRAMEYVARFADERGLPLVMNLSFGVGNELEGGAAIDSLVDHSRSPIPTCCS